MEAEPAPTTDLPALVAELLERVQAEAIASEFRGDRRIVVPAARIHLVLEFFRVHSRDSRIVLVFPLRLRAFA